MNYLILVRHGQSEWNLQKRFTGWVDVELTPNGKLEAYKAGELIKKLNIEIEYFYSSYQKRAIETLNLILNISGQGVLTFPDGATYKGEWANGFMNGEGTFTWSDGKEKTGTWVNGELQE